MISTESGTVLTSGFGGAVKYLVTQGYGVAPTTISVSPFAPVVGYSSTTVFTASVPSNWTLTGSGSLVVAGDNLSATYTAPGSSTTASVQVTDQSNPGNTITTPIIVVPGGESSLLDIVPFGPANRGVVGVH